MGGLKHRERLLARYRAAALIGIRYKNAERALPKPPAGQIFGPEPILVI